MKKIPTLFERDWDNPKKLVINKVKEGCEWVADGGGMATQKLDGTCCLIRDGKLYKRRELRNLDIEEPTGFEQVDYDTETHKRIGWVPVTDDPEDRWHREALEGSFIAKPPDGTYELVGPKIQGNPEHLSSHMLIAHSAAANFLDVPRDFDGIKLWLSGRDIEGLVFHHPDGRMAKIKKRDFGIKR